MTIAKVLRHKATRQYLHLRTTSMPLCLVPDVASATHFSDGATSKRTLDYVGQELIEAGSHNRLIGVNWVYNKRDREKFGDFEKQIRFNPKHYELIRIQMTTIYEILE